MFSAAVKKQQPAWLPAGSSLFGLAQAVHPGGSLSDWIKRGRIMLRLCLFRHYHRQVRAIFHEHPLRQIVFANPRIYEKIYREYLFRGAPLTERLRLLDAHYRFVRKAFDSSSIRSIYVLHNLPLCSIPLSGGAEQVFARLAYRDRFEKEGELTLELHDNTGRRLYSISFSVRPSDGSHAALIGCIVGPPAASSPEEQRPLTIKGLTKGMHGMRPKNLVFFLLQALCRHLGVGEILAVGSDSHVYGGCLKKRGQIRFDYDLFWEELGGRRAQEDRTLFSLPLHHPKRLPGEMRANKRASYLRRYTFLDDLEAQVQLSCVGWGQSVVPAGPGPACPPELDTLVDAA